MTTSDTTCRAGNLRIAYAIAAIALATASVSNAADVDTSSWLCESCPFATGQRTSLDVGVKHVSDSSAKFGDATGYARQGAYADLNGHGDYIRDDHRVRWTLEDLGLDSRFASVTGGRPGTYEYRASYREQPRYVFDTTASVFRGSAGDTLSLPSGWVRSGLTTSMSALQGSLRTQDIKSQRQTLALGGRYTALAGLRFSADYRHEERTGTDVVAGAFFTQASLLPRALDYRTDDLDLSVRYAGANGQLALSWHAGWFQNEGWALTWDNPFAAAPGAAQGRLAQAPDNRTQRIALSGNYRFDHYDTVVAVSIGRGQMQQDDALLPYTINPDLAGTPLPLTRLNGEVDATNLGLTVTARPHRRARVRLAWRYDERDNQTPREQWQRVIVDSFASGDAETNTPYSFERSKLNLSTRVELLEDLDLSAGYDRKQTDRDFQEVAEQTENSGWGRLRWRPGAHLEVSAGGGTSKRDIDRYDTTVATTLGQNPLLRKYDLAYRYRQHRDVSVTATLPSSGLSLSATARFANDDYTKSLLGMRDSDDAGVAVDVDWPISGKATLYLFGGWDRIEASQSASEAFAAADWRATHDDRFVTTSAGLNLRDIAPRTDLRLDYTRSDGRTRIDIDSPSRGRSALPAIKTQLDAVRLRVDRQGSGRLQTSLQLRYERLRSNDWALDGVEPATIATVLALGADPYRYNVIVAGLGFRYAFGGDESGEP